MNRSIAPLVRMLWLAPQLAEVHGNDNDVLGNIARELLEFRDKHFPELANFPRIDEEGAELIGK